MIIDCFIFNGEIELLELRLNLLHKYVDYFLIVESNKTFTYHDKPYYYEIYKDKLTKFQKKINYNKIYENEKLGSPWEHEYRLRDSIRVFLKDFSDDDLLIISDIDEIPNLKNIPINFINKPTILEMPLYYYFFNLRVNKYIWNYLLFIPKSQLINYFLGDRRNFLIQDHETILYSPKNGAHFSYLFGNNIDRYIKKLESFSHSEFNNTQFKNKKWIDHCIRYHKDFLKRKNITLKRCDISEVWDICFFDTLNDLGLINDYCIPTKNFFRDFKISDIYYQVKNIF